MRFFVRALTLGLFLCLAGRGALGEGAALNSSEITASFVVVGDNEVGKEQAGPGNSSFANVAQLRQTLKDISTLEPKPSYIFVTGDMVHNGSDDHGQTLATRLDAWTKLYRQLRREFKLTVPLVPIPGNKDVLRVIVRDGKPVEVINPHTYPVWQKWLNQSGLGQFGGNGPSATAPNADLLAGDNSRLTYSFDDAAGNHYIIINTFTVNNQPEPPRGWVPYHWIAEDARKAEANPRVRRIFAFGHMPIRIGGFPFDPQGDNGILNTESHPLAQELQATLGGLSKFQGYFCGHLHLWDCSLLPGTSDVWQIIAGNAGSKLIQRSGGAWQAPFFFGFTVVRIHRDGQVGVVSYQRPVPEPYDSTAPQPPARPQPEILLPRKRGASSNQLENSP